MTKREQVVKVAEKYVAKGRIDAAIKEYLKVLKENPNDVSTLNRLGDLYARISRIDEAVRLFSQIASQYTEDGFLVKAIAIYKKIIKLDPTRLQVYESLAALYHKQGLVNEARTQYQVLGDYYLKHHDAAAAINIYQKMVELEPDNPSHHLKLAELYQQGQLWDKALRSYRTIAELMLQHGRVEEAVRVYQRAIEVHSDDLAFITDAVLGIKDAGHTGAAAKLLASAVAANPQAEKVARLAGLHQPGVADDRATQPPPAVEPRAAAPEAASPTPYAPPRPAPPPPALVQEEEDEFFVLDIDEPSGSLVMPPADMHEPGTAFQRPAPPPSRTREPEPEVAEREAPDWAAEASEAGAGDVAAGDWGADAGVSGFNFEMPDLEMPDIELEDEVGALGAGAPGAQAAPPARADAAESLDETLLPWDEPLPSFAEEQAAAQLGAAGKREEDVELELDLSQLELESEAADTGAFAEQAAAAEDLTQLDGDVGFELELEEPVAAWQEPGAPAPPPRPAPPPPAPAPPPAPVVEEPRVQDLLAEAEVFAKYSLEEKALERLDQVLTREPHHLEALQLLVDLQIKAGEPARVESAVRRMRQAAEARRAPEVWERVMAKLARAGMALSGDTVAPIRAPQEDRVSQLIRALEQPAPRPAGAPAKKKLSVADALAELAQSAKKPVKAAKPAEPAAPSAPSARPQLVPSPPAAAAGPPPAAAASPPAAAPPPAAAAGPAPTPISAPPPSPVVPPPLEPPAPARPAPPRAAAPPPPAAEELELAPAPPVEHLDEEAFDDELPDIVLPEERHPTAAVPDLDDTGMDWLREEPKAAKAASPDRLFDDEDEFFDLAAELEEELGVEEGPDRRRDPRPERGADARGDRRGLQEGRRREPLARGLRHPLQPRHRLSRDGAPRRGDR